MITHHELKELASYMVEDAFFVSLYLNVDPKENHKESWMLHFRNMMRDTLNKINLKDRSVVETELNHIEKYLVGRPDGLKRGLVVMSCRAKNFWRVYHTALPFNNQLVVERDPYIKPLAAMADLYQRYLVAVVGKTKARVLITSLGEIQEVTKIKFEEEQDFDPDRDGNMSDSSRRAEREEAKVYRLVHKDALKVVEKVLAEEKIKRILLGGTDRGRALFKEAMSSPMRERVVAEFSVDRNASDHEILEMLLPVMKDVEYKFERKALEELFDQGKRSVFGLSDVLTALQQGNVHKIYVLSTVTTPGMACTQCGAITPDHNQICPYCGGSMQRVPYMLDLAIQKAIEQGARVDMLEEAPQLAKAGGIGALMRY